MRRCLLNLGEPAVENGQLRFEGFTGKPEWLKKCRDLALANLDDSQRAVYQRFEQFPGAEHSFVKAMLERLSEKVAQIAQERRERENNNPNSRHRAAAELYRSARESILTDANINDPPHGVETESLRFFPSVAGAAGPNPFQISNAELTAQRQPQEFCPEAIPSICCRAVLNRWRLAEPGQNEARTTLQSLLLLQFLGLIEKSAQASYLRETCTRPPFGGYSAGLRTWDR